MEDASRLLRSRYALVLYRMRVLADGWRGALCAIGLEGKKAFGHRGSVLWLTPFRELTGTWLSLGQTFVAIRVTIRRGLNRTITGSVFMGRLTDKLILFVQIILVGIGVLSLVLGAFALIDKWLSQGS